MKTILKNWSLVALSLFIFISCSSDDVTTEPEPETPAEVSITTFGFYKEDNPEVLFNDYEVEVTNEAITINLPKETDLTNLVARFTTTENDIVKVGGVAQISGTTANDYTGSVEFLVSEKTTNKIYTVTVGKMASSVWSKIGAYLDDSMREISLAIDLKTSDPYVAYIGSRESSEERKLNLIGYKGEDWTRIGAKDFSPRANSVELNFNKEGTPYVIFQDYDADKQASIMSYEANSWAYVGGAPFSGVKVGGNTLAIDADNTLYGFYQNDVSRHEDRRNVFLKTSTSGSWSDLPITGRSGATRIITSKSVNNEVYLAVMDFGDNQFISVYKYANGTWEVLADKMRDGEDHTVYFHNLVMDVDQNGNVYLAYVENTGTATDFQLKVKKYSKESSTWSTFGDMIVTTELRDFDIAVDNYGTAMLFYKNETSTPVFVAYDNDVNNWGAAVTFENVEADELNIVVAPDGIAYAAYLVGDQLYLHKYASPDNQ
ncbi:hypothetical protein KCTC52924_01614 [Arenibacter antarcticus]|uniref:Cadherin-like beta sandwich domain-containing protein n=1 Tax=Arenibacter antarcticus TaxID=2040469 RepID=A0ABW5VKE9_9FLAO|nr:hypothetical protein [Arenibacter sp. H213]MCM4166763.1 hypothetical protein [Arenibacter sp. H213]